MTTTKRTKELTAYDHQYPSVLSWSKRLWVLQTGDLLSRAGVVYRVSQVIRSQIPGAKPRIVLVKHAESLPQSQSPNTTKPRLSVVQSRENQSLSEHSAKTGTTTKTLYPGRRAAGFEISEIDPTF
jgi:hypothetical protein